MNLYGSKSKHCIVIITVILLILSIFFIFAHNYYNKVTIRDVVKNTVVEDLTLVVYCVNPFSLYTRAPWSGEKIVWLHENSNDGIVSKTKISGNELNGFLSSISTIEGSYKTSLDKNTYVDGRIYYYIWASNGNKLLEVLLGGNEHILVNGHYLSSDEGVAFYEIILPYINDENIKHDVIDFLELNNH